MNTSSKHKKKLVIIVSRFPFPLEKGDKLRAYYQLKELSETFTISLITISDQRVKKTDLEEVRKYCSTIYFIKLSKLSILFNLIFHVFTKKPLQIGYFYSSKNKMRIKQILKEVKPDTIYCQLIRVAEYVKNYHDCPKTIDFMDALSKGMERRAAKAPFYSKWLFTLEANRLSQYERKIFDYFEHHIMISEQDKKYILHPDQKKIVCIPNGVDNRFFETAPSEKDMDIVFVGNLSYAPNVEAAIYITQKLIPKLLKVNPSIKTLISGATPHPSLCKAINKIPSIELTGWVDDITSSYRRGKIFVAPLFIGTGMQNKLIEAMALGLPCITTTLANNAIGGKHLESIYVADSLESYIEGINKLLSDQQLYSTIQQNAKNLVKDKYNWKETSHQLAQILSQE